MNIEEVDCQEWLKVSLEYEHCVIASENLFKAFCIICAQEKHYTLPVSKENRWKLSFFLNELDKSALKNAIRGIVEAYSK